MSTVLHTPSESDTALSLYVGDMNSAYYQKYGYYGKPNFIEFAEKLDIVEIRAERILSEFNNKKELAIEFINQSFLNEVVKQKYITNYIEKINRL
jgi:serine/threonine-protein kinase HipA